MSGIALSWSIVGAVVAVLIGVGFSVLSMTPPVFGIARVTFALAAVILAGMTLVWAINAAEPTWWRITALILVGSGVFVLFPEGIRWIARRESTFREQHDTRSSGKAEQQRTATSVVSAVAPKGPPDSTASKRFPDVDVSLDHGDADIFLANHTAKTFVITGRYFSRANRFDQKSLSKRLPAPTFDFGAMQPGSRKRIATLALEDEAEDAFQAYALIDGTNVLYTVLFRKPADVWEFEVVVTDDSRRRIYQRAGTAEDAAIKRRRIRERIAQYILRGNMLKQAIVMLVQPAVHEKTREPIDPTDKLGRISIDVQSWDTEVVFWTQWALGDAYAARLGDPSPSQQYPYGMDRLPSSNIWQLTWDKLARDQAQLQEFLKELPEL